MNRSPARLFGAIRVLVTLHVLLIFGQPVFAGLYLSGDYDMLSLHAQAANYVSYLSYLQLLATLVLGLLKGPRWPFFASLLLTAGETAQYFAGMAGALDLHIPLGVALVAAAALMTVGIWRQPESDGEAAS
jgi:CDP-diglyceride synthetase